MYIRLVPVRGTGEEDEEVEDDEDEDEFEGEGEGEGGDEGSDVGEVGNDAAV